MLAFFRSGCACALVLACAVVNARGQEITASTGALKIERDFFEAGETQWAVVFGGRLGHRLSDQAAIEGELWWGSVTVLVEPGVPLNEGMPASTEHLIEEDDTIVGAGGHLAIRPLGDRQRPIQPVVRFGVEGIGLLGEGGADRSPAFVVGVGLARGGPGWTVAVDLRNHFLRVDREADPGGADASLWEARIALGYSWRGLGGG